MDRATSVTYPDGEVVSYTYNDQLLLASMSGSVVGSIASDLAYNALDLPAQVKLSNQVSDMFLRYRYHALDQYSASYPCGALWDIRLEKTGSNQLRLEHYYDPAGNITRIIETPNGADFTYEYDSLDRLLKRKITGGADQESFTYDQIGNILTRGQDSFTYHSTKKHAVVAAGSQTYAYDANGNMEWRGTTQRLKYDAENRLVKVSSDSDGKLYIARMAYDGDGRRVKRVDNNGTIHYAGPHYERNVGTGLTPSDIVTKYYYAQMGGMKRLIALRRKINGAYEDLRYILPDHLGGTIRTISTSGSNVDDIRYQAFGSTRSGGTNTPTDKRFTGQTNDASSGLYHYGARAYDPSLGRFTQPDTVVPDSKNPQSLNRYSYTVNNPLKFVDPTGHYYSPPALTVTPVQPAPPPTGPGPSPSPMPVPAPTPGTLPAASAAPTPSAAPQAAPTPVAAPTPLPLPSAAPAQPGGAQQSGSPPMPYAAPLEDRWNSFNNLIGWGLGALAGGASQRVDDNNIIVYENVSGVTRVFMDIAGGDPITIGNVILTKEQLPYGSDTYRHERGHAMQSAILGPLYLPTYLANGYAAIKRSGSFDAAKHWHYNDMERWASELAGLPGGWSP